MELSAASAHPLEPRFPPLAIARRAIGVLENWLAPIVDLAVRVVVGTAFFLWLRVDPRHPRTARWRDALSQLGKWSMLDVFVVALSIVAINVSLVSDVTVHAGLYVFCGAIVASMLMVLWIEILIRRLAEETLETAAEGAPGE